MATVGLCQGSVPRIKPGFPAVLLYSVTFIPADISAANTSYWKVMRSEGFVVVSE